MKKLIALVLCLTMFASLCACGSTENEDIKKQSSAETESSVSEETSEETEASYIWTLYYMSLGEMKYIRNAWEFAIDHSTDDTMEEYEALFGLIKETLNADDDELVEALVNYYGDDFYDIYFHDDDAGNRVLSELYTGMLFRDSSPTVYVAKYIFEKQRADMGYSSISEVKELAKETC